MDTQKLKLPKKQRLFGGINQSKENYLLKSKIEKELSSYLWNETIKYLSNL